MLIGVGLALGAAAVWGVAITVAKPGALRMDPVSFIRGRWILATLFASAYAAATGLLVAPSPLAIVWVAAGALLDALLGWVLYMMAMQRAPAYQVTTLASTTPLWGVLASFLLLGEPFRWSSLGAALLVVVGSFFLVGKRDASMREHRIGLLFAALTGLLWGVAETVPMKKALALGVTPETMLVVYGAVALVGVLLLTPLLRRRFPRRVERGGYVFVVLSAICGASIGWLLWMNGLRFADASLLSPIRGSTLLFAFVYSVVFLKERPSRFALIGVALVFAGVLLVSLPG